MHHYKNITIKLIAFSPTLLKTQREELTFTHMGKIKKKRTTTNNFLVRSLKTEKLPKGNTEYPFFQYPLEKEKYQLDVTD